MTDNTGLMDRLASLERENKALQQRIEQYRQDLWTYRRFYEDAPVGLVAIDLVAGRTIAVNRTMLAYVGYSRQEFLALDPAELLTEDSRRRFCDHCAKRGPGAETATGLELQVKIKGGGVLWTLQRIRFLHADDRIAGASVALYPIGDFQSASAALAPSETTFRTIVDTMSDGLLIFDQEGRITHVNKHLEQVSGYRSDELVGKAIHALLSPEAARLICRRLSGKDQHQQRTFEITWQRKSGERQYSLVTPLVLATSGIEGRSASLALITDITSKKKAENAIRQREKELREKNLRLEEMNTALQTLVKMREQDKAEIKRAVSTNLKRLVNPLIQKLRSSGLNERQKLYIDLLTSNLEELASSCDNGFASQMLVLTPAETEVANLIRHGRTTKEIASLMNISIRTVEMHRLNIRRKLGLHRTKTNLRSYLLSS